MKNAHIAVALGAALLAQTALLRMITSGSLPVDLVLVVVVFTGLARGAVAGLWTGTAAGLLQDVLSGGIVGVSGLAKCLTGVLVGLSGTRFIVSAVVSRFFVYVAASLLHAVCYFGVYMLIDTGAPARSGGGAAGAGGSERSGRRRRGLVRGLGAGPVPAAAPGLDTVLGPPLGRPLERW